jgi:hypothetical protein
MRRTATKAARQGSSSEKRKLPRKKALLSAVIAELDGGSPMDCCIRDTTASSAQVSCSQTLPIGAQVYLLDTNNKAAHLARVVWCRSGRAGLDFIDSHAIGLALPAKLKFLWRLFLEAKLKEVYRLVAAGKALDLALSTAGLSEEHLQYMGRYVVAEKRFEILLRLARQPRSGTRLGQIAASGAEGRSVRSKRAVRLLTR